MDERTRQRHTKSHYSLNCRTKTRGAAIKEAEREAESNGGNEREGNVYLFRHNGEGISVHESHTARAQWLFVECTHIYRRCVSMWLIHCATSMPFVVPRCCHDRDLPLLKLITHQYLSITVWPRRVAGNVLVQVTNYGSSLVLNPPKCCCRAVLVRMFRWRRLQFIE